MKMQNRKDSFGDILFSPKRKGNINDSKDRKKTLWTIFLTVFLNKGTSNDLVAMHQQKLYLLENLKALSEITLKKFIEKVNGS